MVLTKNNLSFIVVVAAASLLFLAAPLQAEERIAPGMISVSATGSVSAAPDMALMNLTVLREAETAREALSANNDAMAEIIAEMKKEGIEARDLQTAGISIQPRYVYPSSNSSNPKPPRIVAYVVSNALTVRVRNLDIIGNLLDRSVTLGVNQGGGIQFMVEDTDALLQEARAKAMKNAMEKAKMLTAAAGVGLGRIVSISENSRGGPQPILMAKAMRSEMAMADSAPVEAGEADYAVDVNIAYEIAQ